MNINRQRWIMGVIYLMQIKSSHEEYRKLEIIYNALYGVDEQQAVENLYRLMVDERAQNDMADMDYLILLLEVFLAVRGVDQQQPRTPTELALKALYRWLNVGGLQFAVIKAQEEFAGLAERVVAGTLNLAEAYSSVSLDMRLVFSSFIQRYGEKRRGC